jgi:hypothetical protein
MSATGGNNNANPLNSSQSTNSSGSHERPDPGLSDHTAHELIRAMHEHPGCPICYLTERAVSSYLDWTSYESVNDPQIRERLRSSLGYCAAHGQEWLGRKDALGTAIIYNDVLARLQAILEASGPRKTGSDNRVRSPGGGGLVEKLQTLFGNGMAGTQAGRALADALDPTEPCPACRYTLDFEKRTRASCAEGFANQDFMAAYDRHEMGLCLPHFRQVLRLVGQSALVRALAQSQKTKWARTSTELAEVIRKSDYRYTSEPRGAEFKAPARSVEQVGGRLSTQLNLPKSAQ